MKHKLLILLFLLSGYLALGQNTITGKVTDQASGQGLPGVNIFKVGTSEGAVTDLDGNFKIQAGADDILRFSFIGYKSKEIQVNGRSVIDVNLEEDVTSLSEVVVVGYGTTTKKELTGAISNVSGDAIEERKVPRMDQALQGAVSGVNITTNSASPGGSANINIRGISTNGDNSPLIIVDGVIFPDEGLNSLNPNDIASIDIIKDATAGIYGVRAANGVVIIETKKGKLNSKPTIQFDGYYGVQETSRKLDLLNAREYAILKNEAFAANNQAVPFANTELGEGTDWQDQVFQQAPMQSYNLSVSGGSEKTSYNVGGSYFGQQGIVGDDKANFERYNARLNFVTEVFPKVKLTNTLLYSQERSSGISEGVIGSVLFNAVNAYPTEPVRVDGRFSYLNNVSDIINPVAQIQNTFNDAETNKIVGKQELTYTINDNFEASARIGYNYAIVDVKVFNPLVWYGPGKFANSALNENLDPRIINIGELEVEQGASVFESRESYFNYLAEGFVNYKNTFGDVHNVKGTVGFSFTEESSRILNGTGFNIPNNSLDLADISANKAVGGYLNNVGSSQGLDRLNSVFLRAEYDYSKRYLISGIIRRDGSTKFGPNNRFGYFGSVSGAWVISDEEFFNISAVDFAKLRVSFGVVGNDQISSYAYRANLGGEATYVFNDALLQGAAIGRAANPDLKWEETRQTNIGLDLSLFNNFDFGINYFLKDTKDLLFAPDVSAVLGTYGAGGLAPIVNNGDVRNQGVEFDLNYRATLGKDVNLTLGYNFTYLQNEVTRTAEGIDFIPGAGFSVGGGIATRFEEGFPIGYFNGYKTNGIWQTAEEIASSDVVQPGAQPGDLRFVDVNGDGEINFSNNSDKTQIGSPIPDFTMGFNFSLSAYGFDLSGNIYAALGQEIVRNYERQSPFANQMAYNLNRWTGPGSTNEYPRLTTEGTQNTQFSDFYVEDGSYVRLNNVQIGYTLPVKWSETIKSSKVRFYIAANNAVTLTRYMGYTPDVGSSGVLGNGVDLGRYPVAKILMGGINLQF
ncbi:SusC/RagA family TonB-linked outer membrane protein [Marivirga lumbricoides]|uniref:SusC/RagA family TonB-linked outer membrane protein n=1 Tax=Marivirga lumbricoides TaxID=1046115 RepID=A0ABQ1MD59_9BACT|nr:SusC/RagA family TonB-linked outer membrane protein [Marivirga lumbricoides]